MNLQNKKCYYCGLPAVSREHVPPKQMFKVFQCDRITVYSCAKHNGLKHTDDDTVIKGMLHSLKITQSLHRQRPPEITDAILAADPHMNQVTNMVETRKVFSHTSMPNPPVAFISEQLCSSWMRQLTAGLVYRYQRRIPG